MKEWLQFVSIRSMQRPLEHPFRKERDRNPMKKQTENCMSRIKSIPFCQHPQEETIVSYYVYGIHNPKGRAYLTQLRVGLPN